MTFLMLGSQINHKMCICDSTKIPKCNGNLNTPSYNIERDADCQNENSGINLRGNYVFKLSK